MLERADAEPIQLHCISSLLLVSNVTFQAGVGKSCRSMENYASAHRRHLVLLVCVLQLMAHIQCEGEGLVTVLDGNTGGGNQGQRYAGRFTNPSGNIMVEEVRLTTNLRTIFQTVASLLAIRDKLAEADEKNDVRESQDTKEQVDFEEPENLSGASGAGFVFSAKNREKINSRVDDAAGEPFLLMPFLKSDTPLPCRTGNYIDDCWRCDRAWQDHRQALAACAIGFGSNATGGKNGELYVVTTNHDSIKTPAPGTLRFGATRAEPLWIIFATSMTIHLKGELVMSSYKTIDGRGATVHLVGNSQISIENVSNVIIHGVHLHDIVQSGPHHILTSPSRHTLRAKTLGDAIQIQGSRDVWIDHCFLANATDGLIDGTKNSTSITVSNCYFENHNKVMLFGAGPKDDFDKNMQITVAFNRFGPGLTQRMPRCRYGNCHVANNYYTHGWGLYAIGGSCEPTVLSQGNIFVAAKERKEVTSRIDDGCTGFGDWKKWHWTSSNDSFENNAFFTSSGEKDASSSAYHRALSFNARSASLVPAMTEDAGPLNCVPKTMCKQ